MQIINRVVLCAWVLTAAATGCQSPGHRERNVRAEAEGGQSRSAAGTRRCIAIQPFGDISPAHVEQVVNAVHDICPGASSLVLPGRSLPTEAYYPQRDRYRAETLIADLQTNKAPAHLKVVGVTSNDISTTKGKEYDHGIMGASGVGLDCVIVSTFRLRYGHAPEKLFLERLRAVTSHELGHAFGLDHCARTGCLMEDLRGRIATIDKGTKRFCTDCRERMNAQFRGPSGD